VKQTHAVHTAAVLILALATACALAQDESPVAEQPATAPVVEQPAAAPVVEAAQEPEEDATDVAPPVLELAEDDLLVLPDVAAAPAEEPQAKADAPAPPTLSVDLVGGDPVEPGVVVLARPGEAIDFSIGLDRPARAVAASASGAARHVMDSQRTLTVDATGGQVRFSPPGRVTWIAPDAPGWHRLVFDCAEAVAVARSAAGGPRQSSESTLHPEARPVAVLVQFPFDRNGPGVVDGYPIGIYPNEDALEASSYVRRNRTRYAPPKWLLKVTPETVGLRVSPHFRLGDFSPRGEVDEAHFIALDPRLVELMEAIWTAAVMKYGESARVVILRAYLSPNERERLLRRGVRYTRFTRYQYGDAAAFVVDLDGSGTLGDLNRDGKVGRNDAVALADLVERVQSTGRYIGGLGVVGRPIEPDWPETPFVVVDLRGISTRWEKAND